MLLGVCQKHREPAPPVQVAPQEPWARHGKNVRTKLARKKRPSPASLRVCSALAVLCLALLLLPVLPLSFTAGFPQHGTLKWLGLGGILQIIPFQPSAMGKDIFLSAGLLRALSNLVFETSTQLLRAISRRVGKKKEITHYMLKFWGRIKLDLPILTLVW